MKANDKILLAVAGLVVALLVTVMVIIRNDVQLLFVKSVESKYKTVSVDKFERLDFSANWIVKVRQGDEYKVELLGEGDATLKPRLENIGGTMYFTMDTTNSNENSGSISVRVTAPSLKEITASRGTKIHLADFQSDSLTLILEDGSGFTGYNNQFNYVNFKTTGDVSLQLTEDDFM